MCDVMVCKTSVKLSTAVQLQEKPRAVTAAFCYLFTFPCARFIVHLRNENAWIQSLKLKGLWKYLKIPSPIWPIMCLVGR